MTSPDGETVTFKDYRNFDRDIETSLIALEKEMCSTISKELYVTYTDFSAHDRS
jgi:hypothetical protein